MSATFIMMMYSFKKTSLSNKKQFTYHYVSVDLIKLIWKNKAYGYRQ